MMSRFWKSSRYQLREKPRHTALESPALKEKTMSRMMGRYRKRNIRPIRKRLPVRLAFFI